MMVICVEHDDSNYSNVGYDYGNTGYAGRDDVGDMELMTMILVGRITLRFVALTLGMVMTMMLVMSGYDGDGDDVDYGGDVYADVGYYECGGGVGNVDGYGIAVHCDDFDG